MKHRKLRIVWSVVCGILALAVVALWVRSYLRTEYLERFVDINPMYGLGTKERILNLPGGLEFEKEPVVDPQIHYITNHPRSWQMHALGSPLDSIYGANSFGFKWQSLKSYKLIVFPHWCAVSLIGMAGVFPWIPWLRLTSWRFSLRTLLAGTTLVGIVLGLIVWLR